MNLRPSKWHALPSCLLIAAIVFALVTATKSQTEPTTPQSALPANPIATTTLTTAPAADDPIAAALQQAKAEYKNALERARKELADAIDERINSAADDGDLSTVQALQRMKASIAPGQAAPADVKDMKVIAAKGHYDKEADSAKAILVAAYEEAVRDYTKARRFGEAEAVQNEFNEYKTSSLLTATEPTTAPTDNAGVFRVINLISLVDTKRDAVQGNWRVEDGVLSV